MMMKTMTMIVGCLLATAAGRRMFAQGGRGGARRDLDGDIRECKKGLESKIYVTADFLEPCSLDIRECLYVDRHADNLACSRKMMQFDTTNPRCQTWMENCVPKMQKLFAVMEQRPFAASLEQKPSAHSRRDLFQVAVDITPTHIDPSGSTVDRPGWGRR